MFALVIWLISFFIHTTIWYLVSHILPFGFVPQSELIPNFHLPNFLSFWLNFDGLRYLDLSQHGYIYTLTVFFPILPIFIHIISFLVHNVAQSGLIFCNSCFIGFLYFLPKALKKHNLPNITHFLLIYPTSFFFHAIYTESLFYLLLILGLLTDHFLFYFLLGITRLNGLFSIFFLPRKKTIWPILGLSAYLIYLQIQFHDFLAFIHIQKIFGVQRQGNFILLPQVYYRYFKILFHSDFNIPYLISLIELLMFTLVFFVLLYEFKKQLSKPKSLRFNLAIFSLINLLLPTLTGSFSAIPRYSLLCISQFFVYAEIKNKILKYGVFGIFLILHLILFSLFSRGYFVS